VRHVLFVCTQNAGRSQMAEAFFNLKAPPDVRAESAGQRPLTRVWPEVVEAMREVGLDLAGRRPQTLTREMQLHADWAVTLACGASCPFVPSTVEDWDIADPAGRPLAEVREIRDEIARRVGELLELRIEAIRADRTAHEWRLKSLLPSLAEEFPELSSERIRAVADAALEEFREVPVRSFAMTLAHRNAREWLRSDRPPAVRA
jgi:arsenate reductase